MLKKYVFIHAPELPSVFESLDYIINRITGSNLIYDKIYFSCSSGFSDKVKNRYSNMVNSEFIDNGCGIEDYEYPTLQLIRDLAMNDDFLCLYLHAKGSSKTDHYDLLNAKAWMNYMMYGVVDNAELCVKHLLSGADVVGSQFHWHFKGNFWWAKSAHLKSMPPPMLVKNKLGENPNTEAVARYDAEYWCCLGLWWEGINKPNFKNLFYIPGLQNDSQYAELQNTFALSDISLENKVAFIDHRIDSEQPWSLKQFLELNYKCALDELYILDRDLRLWWKIRDFLNYDAHVTILYDGEDGKYSTHSIGELTHMLTYAQ